MHSFSFHFVALFTILQGLSAAAPPIINNDYAPYKEVTISTPTGPLTVLQSLKIPNFGITNAWPNGRYPTWLRSIDIASTDLLLDILIARYATRPSDDIASYDTIGPESSPALSKLETRVTVKQWVKTNWTRTPAAPMRNKDIACAAQIIKRRYTYKTWPKTEWAFKTVYLTAPDEKGRKYLANFTGVLMVQRDLFFPGEFENGTTSLTGTGRLTDLDSAY